MIQIIASKTKCFANTFSSDLLFLVGVRTCR